MPRSSNSTRCEVSSGKIRSSLPLSMSTAAVTARPLDTPESLITEKGFTVLYGKGKRPLPGGGL